MNAPPPSRQFQIDKPSFGRQYNVLWPNGQPAFHCTISKFTPGTPNLVLHAGADSSAPAVAASYLGHHTRFGVGDVQTGPQQWEDMRRASSDQHSFQATVGPTSWEPAPSRRTYSWQRCGSSFYRLVDAQTGNMVASFTKAGMFSHGGELQITEQRGALFDFMVVISFLSVFEEVAKSKRKKAVIRGAI